MKPGARAGETREENGTGFPRAIPQASVPPRRHGAASANWRDRLDRVSEVRSVQDASTWGPALDEAVRVVSRGELVVLPTDTVYGLGADAFDAAAVAALLAAKGRGRQQPPPVLVPNARTLDVLATDVPEAVRDLVAEFWPGALTVILRAQPSLQWDLGETRGTVALRMPDHPAALALLTRTGPLAVSSANLTTRPAARDVVEAIAQLGESVALYLDGGRTPGALASTIVDATGEELRVVRAGAIDIARLREIAPIAGGGAPEVATAPEASAGDATASPSNPIVPTSTRQDGTNG